MTLRWRILRALHKRLVGQDEVAVARRVLTDRGAVVYYSGQEDPRTSLVVLALKPTVADLGSGMLTQLARNDQVHVVDTRTDREKPLIVVAPLQKDETA